MDGLKSYYSVGQADISRLARICYETDGKTKDWMNIAHLYTHARDNYLLNDVTLPEFVNQELLKYGYSKTPLTLVYDNELEVAKFARKKIISLHNNGHPTKKDVVAISTDKGATIVERRNTATGDEENDAVTKGGKKHSTIGDGEKAIPKIDYVFF